MPHATDNRPAALLAMGPGIAARLLTDRHRTRLATLTRTDPHLVAHDLADPTPEVAAALADAEVLFTCWGATPLSAEVLTAAPRLRAVVHAAGSVKHHITDACWERGIAVTSAAGANALPVAEFTLAAILFANKRVLHSADRYRALRTEHDWLAEFDGTGNYRRTVGIIGASRIGRRVIELLRPFDLDVLLYDPYVDVTEAARLGVRLTSLDELCASSSVVSVHAPQLPETHHLIGAAQLSAMATGTTLINTARGSLIDEGALLPELTSGRLHAVLDVTEPELPPAHSPLYELPNVLLTPHVAGSLGNELHRMADEALDELERYAAGLPFAAPVLAGALPRSA
ncbi:MULTISPECIES: hydroxyacid dehydrogenase [unclassified Streptomyces]|uniref:hydroxyacid dehydrogenase n=1 Tax=unclassified Streptomyces TaxID=2593676 RepID=UPI002252D22A|nr:MULTISPECIES: hydroxyacid dehydrogenase [unclassified Streptomyces]WSP56968.1 hydroxyacid dehydrogenase [Streptomyces sp. NBC_01241]WSU22315.1 hydroxyacid dehydrogenase [Streptomyces sp. NBC_01108]MCX4788757.1 hydroxyacid dehydrogenase [Streptomyces sp. NBC_01221]MCX4795495.1 hydroxyacid dehydrogenase [Streptomyces sp. NBC_01242]WSJ36788.1 hydroxyacid dehydrogenase [Streptomyces sp. NBC_01321]